MAHVGKGGEAMSTIVEIGIAVLVMVAIVSALKGDWRTATGAATGAVVLGV
jgi:hypothetical protein